MEGTTIAPNRDFDLENCQILGRSKGDSKTEALNNLISENPWIIEAGFNPANIVGVQILSNCIL